MIVMTNEELEAFRKLQDEHESFWREQYPTPRTPLRERLWDWCSDHQMVLTVLMFVALVIFAIISIYYTWIIGVIIIVALIGCFGYILWSMANGIVQAILDWLM